MTALIFYLFLALFISFVCSLVEATLLTIPRSYLLSIEKNNEWATSFLSFKNNIDKPLSAILTLNTIAHTIGAAGVGAEVTGLFGDNYLGFASAILTIFKNAKKTFPQANINQRRKVGRPSKKKEA